MRATRFWIRHTILYRLSLLATEMVFLLPMATRLLSPPLSCPWVTSRDVIKGFPRRRQEWVRKRNRVDSLRVAAVAMMEESVLAASAASSVIQLHQWWQHSPDSVLLMAESGGYSLASYYTSLGLFVISVPGLWSLIKRSVKSKIVRKTFVSESGVMKEPKQVAGEILSFFTRKNFNITDRGETITFEGMMVPSRGQAALLTFCTCISLASVALVLTITVPDVGNTWFLITILSPLAGVYYWSKASRKEEIKVKMILGEKGKLSEIVVQGDDVQVEEMRKELQLSEKGMVYVKGLFERS